MKVLLAVLIFELLALSVNPQVSSTQHAAKKQTPLFDKRSADGLALLSRINAWKDAYNSKDTARLAAFYTEDADYVSPHVVDLRIEGRDALRDNFYRGISGGGHIDTIKVLRTDISCNLAYLVCTYEATNAGVKVSGRNVILLKRIDDAWLIQTHASIVRD